VQFLGLFIDFHHFDWGGQRSEYRVYWHAIPSFTLPKLGVNLCRLAGTLTLELTTYNPSLNNNGTFLELAVIRCEQHGKKKIYLEWPNVMPQLDSQSTHFILFFVGGLAKRFAVGNSLEQLLQHIRLTCMICWNLVRSKISYNFWVWPEDVDCGTSYHNIQ